MKFFTAAIIAVMLAVPVHAGTIQGTVTHVTDGDTLWVKPSSGGEALDVRIQGIDAPESCQDYGHAAQQALSRHVLHKSVTLTTKARDKYGRVIAKVSLGNQDVGAWMVKSGHAWSYHFHKSRGPYANEEKAARQAGRGLWGYPNAIEPREFRKFMRGAKCHKPRR
jgi:endonuclease YncB( thermonuclease family)